MAKYRRRPPATVQVREYNVCKKRVCRKKGRHVECTDSYHFKPEGRKFRLPREELKLHVSRTVPLLAFMAAEACAHGIFPSNVGGEVVHSLKEITSSISTKGSRRFLFDAGSVYRGVYT